MDAYWNKIEFLNTIAHKFVGSELEMEINEKRKFPEIIKGIHESINGIMELLDVCEKSDNKLLDDFYRFVETKNIKREFFENVPYYENPFINRNWEIHNLGKHNLFQRLQIDLIHFEIIFYQEYLKLNKDDVATRQNFDKLKKEFEGLAQIAMHID